MTARKDTHTMALQRWGAKTVPFMDPAPLYLTPSIEDALAQLDDMAALRSTGVLYGDNGVGKSRVVGHWLSELESKRFRTVVITHATLSGSGLLGHLLQKLGCTVRLQRSRNLVMLEEAVTRLDRQILVVVLDEAQLYTADALEEIRLLLGLNLPSQPLFALILIGDNYLLDSLKLHSQKALYSRIAATVEITRLRPDEAQAFVIHQLAHVGINRPAFEDAALQMLLAAADGIPRTLNLLARAAWLRAAVNHDLISPDHVRSAIRSVPSARDNIEPA